MLTAHALPEERERAIAAGADAYCTKPIDFPKLFATCRRLVDGKGRVPRAA